MSATSIGLLAGILLGVAAAADGFTGFLVALVLGIVGLLVGSQLDGNLDLRTLLRGRGRG